ncbi:hypothetical protein RFI_00693, partial [Reticulomyxa filosa]
FNYSFAVSKDFVKLYHLHYYLTKNSHSCVLFCSIMIVEQYAIGLIFNSKKKIPTIKNFVNLNTQEICGKDEETIVNMSDLKEEETKGKDRIGVAP